MRKRIAIGISLLTLLLAFTLAVRFAVVQNPRPAGGEALAGDASVPAAPPGRSGAGGARIEEQAADSVRGRAVFRKANCERCHSVEGLGNSRYPLDGVGDRRTRAALRAWALAEGAVVDSLSPAAARAKRAYAELPPADLKALIDYLGRLVRKRR